MRALQDISEVERQRCQESEIHAREALFHAQRLARAMLKGRGRANGCEAEDVASAAILRLLIEPRPVTLSSIKLSVRREVWRLNAARRTERRFLQRWWYWARLSGGATVENPEQVVESTDSSELVLLGRKNFLDGSQAYLAEQNPCGADLSEIEVTLPDGHTVRGEEARRHAHVALLLEARCNKRPQQMSNAQRAARAVYRDHLLLSVVGLPWQQALPLLAEKGLVLTRAALRSGLRAARLRCDGKTAHHRASERFNMDRPHTPVPS